MRVLCVVVLLVGSGCEKWKEAKTFLQARPLDDKTALEVDTAPALGGVLKGSIDIDGRNVGTKTPHTEKPISPGKHQVRVTALGYISQEMEIDVKEGDTTTLSLALKTLPSEANSKPQVPTTATGASKGKKKAEKEEDDPADTDPVSHSTRTFVVTSSPPQASVLDGSPLGTASGLRVQVVTSSAELRVGDEASGIVFSIANRRSGLRLKVKNLGQRSVMVDGSALSAKNGFGLDTRPRRIEFTDVDGNKLVVLMKLIE